MENFKEHYEHKKTEELLYIAEKDLTDAAREALHSELERRGVDVKLAIFTRTAAVEKTTAVTIAQDRLASLGARFCALAIDVFGVIIILSIILIPLGVISNELSLIVFSLIWYSYFLLRDSIPGQGLGKRLLRIRTVQVNSGHKCTWSKSLWRNLTHMFLLFDALFALGERRMRLGDMIAETEVIKVSS